VSSTPRTFDHASMALRGRIGAYVQKSRHDPRELTKAGRAAFNARFLAEVDPDLPEAERHRRAEEARKAYFARLAYKSAEARRQRSKSKKWP
jgi:hypothetical protein